MDQDRAIGGMAMIELFEQNGKMQEFGIKRIILDMKGWQSI